MQPASWDDAEQEDNDEAAKGIAVDADQLTIDTSTSESFKESHFKNFSRK